MVEERIEDGRRIAQLLSSEVEGREDGELAAFSVANADRDVEPTTDGARAYDLRFEGERVVRVYVQPDRARLEVATGRDAAAQAGTDAGLRVRPKATTPPKTLVFVESGAEVKRATDVLRAMGRSLE